VAPMCCTRRPFRCELLQRDTAQSHSLIAGCLTVWLEGKTSGCMNTLTPVLCCSCAVVCCRHLPLPVAGCWPLGSYCYYRQPCSWTQLRGSAVYLG
jgi:hypothetical protein